MSTTSRGAWTQPPRGFVATEKDGIGRRVGKITTVDEEAWTRLVVELHRQYDQLRQTIQSRALDSAETFGGAVAAIAHLAYHLGAVRQKTALLHQR